MRYFQNWSEMPFRWVRLIVALGFVVLDFGSAIYRRYLTCEGLNTSVAAHVGGAITGLCIGLIMLK